MSKLLLALALVPIWAAPAFAQPADPGEGTEFEELTAVPRELRAGEDVTVSGAGCAPGNQVRFELYNPDLHSSADGVVRGDGTFVQSVNLPSTTKPGRSWLRATCLTAEADQKVMEAVLLVNRPEFVVTWTNVVFGLGTALVTAGIGLAMLRPPDRRHPTRRRVKSRRRRRKKGRGSSSSRSNLPDPSLDGIPVDRRSGAGSNGTKEKAERTIEVD